MSDKAQILVHRTLAGDTEAFGILVDQYSGWVHSLVLELVRRPEDVQDLVQEVFCKAYQQLPALRRPASFPAWLGQIAHRTALSWLRQEKSRRRIEAADQPWALPAPPSLPDRLIEEKEHAELLWQLLDQLPAAQRRAVVLFYLEECTYREIAHFLDRSVATVRWYLFCAERRLGQDLSLRLGQEWKKERLDRRRLREKVLAGLPLGLGAYSRTEALSGSPLGAQVQGISSQGLLVACFLGSALVHLLGMGALRYGWEPAAGLASGASLLRLEKPAALAASSPAGMEQAGPAEEQGQAPAVRESRPPQAAPGEPRYPARPWLPEASAGVLEEMAAQALGEEPAEQVAALPRRESLGQLDLSLSPAEAASPFDSLASEYERSGQLQALVRYENPADPQSIQGFVHLGLVQSLRVHQAGAAGGGAATGQQLRQLDALVQALETFTQLKAGVAPSLTYADPRLLDLPLVVPLSLPNESEMEPLSRYLMAGGFVLSFSMPFEVFREGLEKYGHLVWGKEVWTEYLTEDHPLFSAYFPLQGVPRTERALTTGDIPSRSGALSGGSPRLRRDRMPGLFVQGRLAGVEFHMPARPMEGVKQYEDMTQSQLAVNIAVYALTQEGSLARRRAPAQD